jgi:hypothetical protein
MEHDHALKLMDPLHQDSSQANLDFALFLLVRVHRAGYIFRLICSRV